MIERPLYMEKLIRSIGNGFPKVITGLRRCGKSYLLEHALVSYLKSQGIADDHFITLELDDALNAKYRDPLNLVDYVLERSQGGGTYYVILDEIQQVYSIINPELTGGVHVKAKETDEDVISFVHVVLGLSRRPNLEVFVTGSNSKMLSSDVATEFRDKATTIAMAPLSFSEFHAFSRGTSDRDYAEYSLHGGMPLAVLKDPEDKESYLNELFELTYFQDVLEHHRFHRSDILEEACTVLSQTVGQLQNAGRIAHRLRSVHHVEIDEGTVSEYIRSFTDAFLLRPAERYDLKGGAIIGGSRKYYFADTGLRNARLSFAFPDQGQIMENIIFNELIYRGYNVRVGCFDSIEKDAQGRSVRVNNEVDFLAVMGGESIYIQSCYALADAKTIARESRPFDLLRNARRKIIVVKEPVPRTKTELGYEVVGVTDFLLDLR